METTQEQWSSLYILFGTLLVSAQIFEFCFLVFNVLPSKRQEPINALTRSSVLSVRPWQNKVENFSKSIMEVFHDFQSGHYYIPFARKTPVIIRSPEHIQELSEAQELSQRAVYADIFGFQYTVHHSEQSLDPNEQAAHRYRLFSRTIKIAGLAQIASLQPHLQAKLEKILLADIDSQPSEAGWTSVRIAPVMRDLAMGMLDVYFFGQELSEEPEFSSALRGFYQDVMACAGALQVVPSFMAFFVHSLITKRGRALNTIFKRLHRVMDPKHNEVKEKETLGSMTLFYNMIEATRDMEYWSSNVLIQAIVGIWFAASHQPWTSLHFALLELCRHPEYIELLCEEIASQERLDYTTISTLPILDSFVKETARLNPPDLSYDIMHDEAKYLNSHTFDGLRFVKDASVILGSNS
ncbi:hypothetical protein MMC28_011521 [Mycoblastus sanguinarius]|nr:hypothetical protein [Mycoblastus sanguinarius]